MNNTDFSKESGFLAAAKLLKTLKILHGKDIGFSLIFDRHCIVFWLKNRAWQLCNYIAILSKSIDLG